MSELENRRRSYRLDDRIRMWIRPLSEASLEEILRDFDRYRIKYSLKSHFVFQRDLWQPMFQELRKRDLGFATYLGHLEQQIIELAERLEASAEFGPDRIKTLCDVNISSQGIRVQTDQDLEPGQFVELGMELYTSETQIVLIARAVPDPESRAGPHSALLDYVHVHEEDSEAIIRHMARLQQLQLQSKRAS